MKRHWIALTLAVAAAGAVTWHAMRPARAEVRTYNVTMKGVSNTTSDDKFKFTGTGTLSFDDVAGTFSYSIELSNGLTFAGSDGVSGVSGKNKVFAVASSSSGGINGTAIFVGKIKSAGKKFSAKVTAAIPNRLGPPPAGFVLTTGKVSGTLAD